MEQINERELDLQRERAKRQESTLYESINVLCEEEDTGKAINTFLKMSTEYYDAARTMIYEKEGESVMICKTYEYSTNRVTGRGGPPERFPISVMQGVGEHLLMTGDPRIFRREDENSPFPFERFPYLENIAFLPMKVNGKILGVVSMINSRVSLDDPMIFRTAGAFCLNAILRRNQTDEEHLVLNEIAESFRFVAYVDFESDHMRVYRVSDRKGFAALNVNTYSEFVAACLSAGIVPDDRARFRVMTSPGYVQEQFTKKTTVSMSFVVENGGARFNYELQFIRGNKEGTRAVLSLADNTEIIRHETDIQNRLKEAKEVAEAASHAKSVFLAKMSHDIRTPINGVIGMTDIARKYIDDKDRVMDSLDKIHLASHHLLALLNDVLDMSLIESGKTKITKGPMNIRNFAENCCTIMESQIQEKGITFIRKYDDFSSEEVMGDELLLRRAIINILGNAVKFTPAGGVIVFAVEELEASDDEIRFRFVVTDNGKGMKPEFVERIWEPFVQEDTSIHTSYKGSGLGMTICKQLIDMMGGNISVKSVENEGTTFAIEISLEVNKNLRILELKESEVDIKGAHILVAEDNPINVEIVKEILTSEGAIPAIAENGKAAVDLFSKAEPGQFNLILMDIMMPVLDGLEAAKRIRELDREDARSIPIIAMTANAFDEDIKKSRAAGMDAHLSKPIQVTVMLKTISYFIREGRKSEKQWNTNS